MPTAEDKRAPMASAPLVYAPDGSVDWGNMWDSFCALALDGGPPHRGEMLAAPEAPDTAADGYSFAEREIIRGIHAVCDLKAEPAPPGWIRIHARSAAQAGWLAEAIEGENVAARTEGPDVYVPVSHEYTLKGEIKNVVTAVAKTTHYWEVHLGRGTRMALGVAEWVVGKFKRKPRV